MDTDNERDTHFQEFAKLLWVEILQSQNFSYKSHFTEERADAIKLIIARRAYDLVYHALMSIDIVSIPDMRLFSEDS